MATIKFGNSIGTGADMRYNDFFYGFQTVDSARIQQYTDGQYRITFSGQFYSDEFEFYGRLDTIVETQYGRAVYTATDIGADAKVVWNLAQADDDDGALRYLTSGDDSIIGTRYADVLRGNAGDDYLYGDRGADRINGGRGSDMIASGLGRDRLTGGSGADWFDFKTEAGAGLGGGRDVITDFSHAQHDRIDLIGIDAKNSIRGNQAFDYIGGKGFSGHAGEVRFSGEVVSGDVNGDRIADFQIQVADVARLSASDFFL